MGLFQTVLNEVAAKSQARIREAAVNVSPSSVGSGMERTSTRMIFFTAGLKEL